jgi:mono/diheme cytochrome c family protein
MKTKLFFLTFFSASLLFTACDKDSDAVAVKVTYDNDAKPIFVANCTPCHLTGGANPNKWDDYATAKSKIDVILDRVNRAEGAAGHMPKNGPKLSDATIAILTQWKADGLLEK